MKSYRFYYQLLDELRIAKSFTVSQLCEDIISERTYYRNMISNKDMRFDVFSKLATRLGVQPFEIVHYSTFIKDGDPGASRFIYRVHLQHFSDIDEIYAQIINHQDDNFEFGLLLQANILKYHYLINKISLDEYRSKLSEIIIQLNPLELHNPYIVSLFALYVNEYPMNELLNMDKLLEKMLELNDNLGIIFMLISHDLLLYKMIGSRTIDNILFSKCVEKFKGIVNYFPHKYFHGRYCLFAAYNDLLSNQLDSMETNLYRYFINQIILTGNQQYIDEVKKVSEAFQIDYHQFLRKKSIEYFHSSQFEVSSN
ncbi:MAG: hypothetical protein KKE16_04465 [Firmicutes bacterium]|nr:hypothetical protein [Bacillota bacterium]